MVKMVETVEMVEMVEMEKPFPFQPLFSILSITQHYTFNPVDPFSEEGHRTDRLSDVQVFCLIGCKTRKAPTGM